MSKAALALISALLASTGWASESNYITYSQDYLAANRVSITLRQGMALPAYDALIERADEALLAPLYTVTKKTQLPASGDRHDYFSFAPYWWPNPETDDGLPYVRRDGEYNEATKSNATDKQRMIDFAKDVHALGLAYYFSRNRVYAEKAAQQVEAWFVDPGTRMNPNMRHAQAIPGREDGRDIGIIDSRLLIQVADAVELIRPAGVLTEETYASVQGWYRQFLQWLLTSENGKEESRADNNHGTWYDAQVVAFALFTHQHDIAERQLKRAQRRIAEHFDATGRQKEELERTRPWHYTNFNLEAFQKLGIYSERLGKSIWDYQEQQHSLHAGFDFVAEHAYRRTWPFEELEGFEATDALSNMLAAAHAYNEIRYFRIASELARQAPDDISLLIYPLYPIK